MIRDLIKSTVKKAVGRVMGSPAPSAPPPPPPAPRWADAPVRAAPPPAPVAPVVAPVPVASEPEVELAPVEPVAIPAEAPEAVVEAVPAEEAPAPVKKRGGRKKKDAAAIVAALEEAAPVEAPAPESVTAAAPSEVVATVAPADDTAGSAFLEELQAYVDEFVRPALQSDGGDMTIVKYEDDVLYVSLVGACKTCPSSTMTLRLGVESTLKEEFPQIRELVQVE